MNPPPDLRLKWGGLQLCRQPCLESISPPTSRTSLGGFTLARPSCMLSLCTINVETQWLRCLRCVQFQSNQCMKWCKLSLSYIFPLCYSLKFFFFPLFFRYPFANVKVENGVHSEKFHAWDEFIIALVLLNGIHLMYLPRREPIKLELWPLVLNF